MADTRTKRCLGFTVRIKSLGGEITCQGREILGEGEVADGERNSDDKIGRNDVQTMQKPPCMTIVRKPDLVQREA